MTIHHLKTVSSLSPGDDVDEVNDDFEEDNDTRDDQQRQYEDERGVDDE